MKEELLIKFLNNRCTADEVEEIVCWVNAEAKTQKGKNLIYNDWKSYNEDDYQDKEDYDALLDKIHHKINIEKNKPDSSNNGKATLTIFSTWITRAAAILLIPVLGFLFYTMSEDKTLPVEADNLHVQSVEISAPLGSRSKIELSDGSVVHLNYGSKLKYPLVFTGTTREVILSGEGYFEVAHNPQKPFVVKTGQLNVKALGTSFNVSAYPGEDNVKTTLIEGKVALEQTENDVVVKSIGTMVPDQNVTYNINTGKITSKLGNVERYVGWKDGKLIFDNSSVREVAQKLNQMFNVEIEVAKSVQDVTYSVTFIDEPLFQILDLMTLAAPIVYKTFPRKKLPDGTFSKQRIRIENRK